VFQLHCQTKMFALRYEYYQEQVFKLSYFDATAATAITTTAATTKPLQALTKNKLRDYVGSSLRERHSNQIATLKISLLLPLSPSFSISLSRSLRLSLFFISLSFSLYLHLSLFLFLSLSLPLSLSLSRSFSFSFSLSLSLPLSLTRLITVFGWAKWNYHVSLINLIIFQFKLFLVVRGEI